METKVICLDTSVLIDYFRKKNKQQTSLYQLSLRRVNFAVTSITIFEIFRGCTPTQWTFWEEVFNRMEVLPFDEQASKLASQLHQKLNARNKMVDLPDLFIASIALQNALPIATLNRRDFERIPGLIVLADVSL